MVELLLLVLVWWRHPRVTDDRRAWWVITLILAMVGSSVLMSGWLAPLLASLALISLALLARGRR